MLIGDCAAFGVVGLLQLIQQHTLSGGDRVANLFFG